MDKARATKRIQREMIELSKNPSKHWKVMPVDEDFFEWHFTIRGPSGSDFEDGRYHGRICLPVNYPFAPPSIMLLTPNGRFEVNTKICLSASNYHPELWQPAWGIRTILEALRSFFPTPAEGALGSLDWPSHVRKQIAKEETGKWHCAVCNATNDEILPLLPLEDEDEASASSPVPHLPAESDGGADRGSAGDAAVPPVEAKIVFSAPAPASAAATDAAETPAASPSPPAVASMSTTTTTAAAPAAATAAPSPVIPAPSSATPSVSKAPTQVPASAPAAGAAPGASSSTTSRPDETPVRDVRPANNAGGLGMDQPSSSSSAPSGAAVAGAGGAIHRDGDAGEASGSSGEARRRRQQRVDRPIIMQLLPAKPQDKREATLYIIDILLLCTASLIGYFAYDIFKKPPF